jgi:hypothetical protein
VFEEISPSSQRGDVIADGESGICATPLGHDGELIDDYQLENSWCLSYNTTALYARVSGNNTTGHHAYDHPA